MMSQFFEALASLCIIIAVIKIGVWLYVFIPGGYLIVAGIVFYVISIIISEYSYEY